MLDQTLTITDGTDSIVLRRVKSGNLASEYYFNDAANNRRFTLNVNHTVPKSEIGESHLVRLNISHYDTTGQLIRVTSAWVVLKTSSGIQDDPACAQTHAFLSSITGNSAILGQVIARES